MAGVGGTRIWLTEKPISIPEKERDSPAGREALARLIADAMAEAGLSLRNLHGLTVGVSGPDVILKQIQLPLMDDTEVGPALRFEARKHLPFEIQNMVIDFQILARSVTERRLDLLLAAVPQERLDRTTAPFRMLGVEVDIVDAAPLALANALFRKVDPDQEAHILLDLGHSASHLILYQRSQPFFSRRMDFGGRTLTEAVARGMKVPFEEAEEWKVSAGSDRPGFRVDWSMPEMGFMLDALRFQLLEDVRRSLAFYRTIGSLPERLSLWLSGGSARLPGLADRLQELLECPVRVFNPMESLSGATDHPAVAPQFAQAYGLSLRSP
jgi:type IV pilus assembly protein PilM